MTLHKACECEIQTQQEKEAPQVQLVDVNSQLEGAELARSTKQTVKEKAED